MKSRNLVWENTTSGPVVLPLSLGAHFRISRRAFFSLGVSYYYAFTDLLDNVAFEGTR